MGAGLPGWEALLRKLAEETKMSAEEIAAMKVRSAHSFALSAPLTINQELSLLDQARIVERRLGSAEALQKAIAEKLKAFVMLCESIATLLSTCMSVSSRAYLSAHLTRPCYSLAHALLAGLPVKEGSCRVLCCAPMSKKKKKNTAFSNSLTTFQW